MAKNSMDKIGKLVEDKMYKFLSRDPNKVKKDIFYMEATQMKIGMNYERDKAVMKRINAGQMIRVVNLIATNPVEKKAYLEATMPELSVVDQIEGGR